VADLSLRDVARLGHLSKATDRNVFSALLHSSTVLERSRHRRLDFSRAVLAGSRSAGGHGRAVVFELSPDYATDIPVRRHQRFHSTEPCVVPHAQSASCALSPARRYSPGKLRGCALRSSSWWIVAVETREERPS